MSEESQAVKDWLMSVGPNTRWGYTYFLKQFCKFVGLTPDQIIKLGIEDRRAVHRKLKEWYAQHKSRGLASGTRMRAYTTIRSFLSWNDISLGRTPYPFRAAVRYETLRILTADELSKMITIARMTRDKAIISFLAQSGQRSGILRAMRYGQVREQLEKQLDPILIRIPGDFLDADGENVNKIREKYEFAIGKECAMFLRIMMQERVAAGEKIADDSWLFRSYAESQVRNGKYVYSGDRNQFAIAAVHRVSEHRECAALVLQAGSALLAVIAKMHGGEQNALTNGESGNVLADFDDLSGDIAT